MGYYGEPQESLPGVLITVSSAVLITILFVFKKDITQKLGSRALSAEAYESLMCDLQDIVVAVGLGLNILLGWWWADPAMALALVPFSYQRRTCILQRRRIERILAASKIF